MPSMCPHDILTAFFFIWVLLFSSAVGKAFSSKVRIGG